MLAAVHVRVGHQNYFVIAKFSGIKIVFADTGAERRDDAADFLVAQHLVVARLFDVQDFPFERQDRLIAAVAPSTSWPSRPPILPQR